MRNLPNLSLTAWALIALPTLVAARCIVMTVVPQLLSCRRAGSRAQRAPHNLKDCFQSHSRIPDSFPVPPVEWDLSVSAFLSL
jgi:hypothetical protein